MFNIFDQLNDQLLITDQAAKTQFCNAQKSIVHQHSSEKLKRYQALEQELQTFLSIATDIHAILNEHLEIISCNNGFQNILGWEESEVLKKNYVEFIDYPDAVQIITAINECKASGQVATDIAKCKCKEGKYKWIEWRGKYIANKKIHLLTGRDITLQKEQEEERLAKREAEELEMLKDEFLINMSHELKTPLNVIYMTLQLESEEIKSALEKKGQGIELNILKRHDKIIQRNVYRLLRLIRNLTEIAKLESDEYRLNFINCDIVSIVRQISLAVVDHMQSTKVKITFDTDIQELITACDPSAIEQIMLNLLSNTIKYRKDESKVRVSVTVKDNKVRVTVKDNGIGIPKTELEYIFKRFAKIDTSLNRKCEGSGTGLTVSKYLVELHEGSIWAKSQLNKGSSFIFEIPIVQISDEKDIYYGSTSQQIEEKCNIEFSDIYDI